MVDGPVRKDDNIVARFDQEGFLEAPTLEVGSGVFSVQQ